MTTAAVLAIPGVVATTRVRGDLVADPTPTPMQQHIHIGIANDTMIMKNVPPIIPPTSPPTSACKKKHNSTMNVGSSYIVHMAY